MFITPAPSDAIPEKVVDVGLSPPVVSVTFPATPVVTDPAPVREPMVELKPFRSNVPVTVTALKGAIPAFAAPIFNVPAVMVVEPVYVPALDRVHAPAPNFITDPTPVAIPEAIVPLPDPVNVKANAPVILPVFVRLISPQFVPIVEIAPIVTNPG